MAERFQALLARLRRGLVVHQRQADHAGRLESQIHLLEGALGAKDCQHAHEELSWDENMEQITRAVANAVFLNLCDHQRNLWLEWQRGEVTAHSRADLLLVEAEQVRQIKMKWDDSDVLSDKWSVPFFHMQIAEVLTKTESMLREVQKRDGQMFMRFMYCLNMLGQNGVTVLMGRDEQGEFFIEPMVGARSLRGA